MPIAAFVRAIACRNVRSKLRRAPGAPLNFRMSRNAAKREPNGTTIRNCRTCQILAACAKKAGRSPLGFLYLYTALRGWCVLGHGLHRQADAALLVDFEHLDLDDVAFLELVGNLLDALVGNLRDVDEAVLARQDGDERAEIHQLGYLAFVDAARLDVGDNLLDARLRRFGRFAIDRGDDDGAVVADVYRGAGFFGDRADRGAALTDDFADLV